MQFEVSRVDDATSRLEVTLSAEDVNTVIDATYQRLAKRLKIPGFRPGKAPRPMILRSYGEHDFYHTATDEAVRTWYPRALRESGIRALDSGELEPDEEDRHLTPGEPFTFAAVVPTVPEIEVPDYGSIKIPAPSATVADSDVDRIIDEVRAARSSLEAAPSRAAEIGDVVKLNIRGRAGGEEVLNQEDFDFELIDEEKGEGEDSSALPGLSKELTGARRGDIREITLSLPAEYRDQDLAGKALILNVVVKEVQRKVLPELNDELVQQVSKDAKTVAELREAIRHNLEHERNEEAINSVAKEVVDSLIARANPPAPEVLVGEEQDRMMRDHRRMIERSGMRFDRFLIAAQKSEDEYREELRPAAERAVKRDLVLDAVARAENLEPDADAVDAEVRLMSGAVSRSERDYERLAESRRLHDIVAEEMRRRSALRKLVELASGLTPLVHDHEEHEHTAEEPNVEEPEPAEAVAGA